MSTIKNELVNRHRFKSRDEARLAVFSFIEGFYNPHRRHSSLGYRPDGVREDVGGGRRSGGFRSKLRCQQERGNPNPMSQDASSPRASRNRW
jgi:hypothetical protein